MEGVGYFDSLITNLDTSNLKHEHGCSKDMTSIVTPKFDAFNLLLLMEVDGLDLVHGRLQVALGVQHLIRGDVTHLKKDLI